MKFENNNNQQGGGVVPIKQQQQQQQHQTTSSSGIQYDEETYVSDSEYEVVDDIVEEYTVVDDDDDEMMVVEEEIIEEFTDEEFEEVIDDDDDDDDEDGNSSDYDSDPPPDPNDDDADSVATEDIDGFMLNLQGGGDARVSCISMGDFLMDYGPRYNVEEFNSDEEEEEVVRDGLGSSMRSEVSELGASGRFNMMNFGPDGGYNMDSSRRSGSGHRGGMDLSRRSKDASIDSLYNIQRITPLGMASPQGTNSPTKKKKLGAQLKILSPQKQKQPQSKKAGARIARSNKIRRKKDPSPTRGDETPPTQQQKPTRKIRYVPNASNAASRRRGGKPTSMSNLRTSKSNLMSITETTEEMQNSAATFNLTDLPPTAEDGNESDDSTKHSLPAQGYQKKKKGGGSASGGAGTKVGSSGPKPSAAPAPPTKITTTAKVGSFGPAKPPAHVGLPPSTKTATSTTAKIGSFGPKSTPPTPPSATTTTTTTTTATTTKVGSVGSQVDFIKQKLPKRMDPPAAVAADVVVEEKSLPIRIPAQSLSLDRRSSFSRSRSNSTSKIESGSRRSRSKSKDRSRQKSRSKSPTSNRHRSKSPTSNRHRSKSPTSNRHRSKSASRSGRSESPPPKEEETKLRRRLKTTTTTSSSSHSRTGSPTRGVRASKSMDSALSSPRVSSHSRRKARSTSPELRLDESLPERNIKDPQASTTTSTTTSSTSSSQRRRRGGDSLSSSSHRRKERDPLSSSSHRRKERDQLSSSSHRRKERDPLSSSSHSGDRRRQLRHTKSDTKLDSSRSPDDDADMMSPQARNNKELSSSAHRRARVKRGTRSSPKESKRVSRFSDLLTKMSSSN